MSDGASDQNGLTVPPYEPIKGPYVSYMLICEKILREQDGVQSFIRATDAFSTNGGQLPIEFKPYVAIGLRGASGEYVGTVFYLVVRRIGASPDMPPNFATALQTAEDVPAVDLTAEIGPIDISEFGEYRISVIADGRELSAIEFQIQEDPLLAQPEKIAVLTPQED